MATGSMTLNLRYEDGRTETLVAVPPLVIGRDPECDLRIRGWRVARRHARLEARDRGLFLEDFGSLAGTLVNGQRVSRYGPFSCGDQLIIGPCLITLETWSEGAARPEIPGPGPGFAAAGPTLYRPGVTAGEAGRPSTLAHRRRLHAALIEALDLRRRDVASMSDEVLRMEARSSLAQLIELDTELPPAVDRDELLKEVLDEAVGLGPLEPLLSEDTITEIMVNRYDEIFVESAGRLYRHASGFSSEQAVLAIIERIVSPLGRRIDESSPMVDARLPDGSRVNAVIAPIALRGASLTIRKFPQTRLDMADLVRNGSLDGSMRDFLVHCVAHRKNIIVSGGTGSGKTTLLNILSNAIPHTERIVTIEDAAELRLDHANLVALEARPPNLEGRGRVEIRDLVRNALRMRPDRIVIGECRGGEAFDMLAAMNTGHEGSLTTLHANSPRDALGRLETMILMAGMELPLSAVREHIAASIDLIVQQARLSNGRRVVTAIVEVTGMESGRIQTQELFHYQAGPEPAFVGAGVIPDFLARETGPEILDPRLFDQRTPVAADRSPPC